MVDKMLLSYVNQMYILESELYSLCQIKSSLENERTVQMNRIQDENFLIVYLGIVIQILGSM